MDGSNWVAVAGIAGTLIGTGLGAFVTWRIQERRLRYDHDIRFHDRLRVLCATFLNSALDISTYLSSQTSAPDNNIKEFREANVELSFISPERIAKEGAKITFILNLGIQKGVPNTQGFDAIWPRFVLGFREAVREELLERRAPPSRGQQFDFILRTLATLSWISAAWLLALVAIAVGDVGKKAVGFLLQTPLFWGPLVVGISAFWLRHFLAIGESE